jgi:phosphonate transport system permease protein
VIKREAEAVYPDPARSGIRAVPTRFVVTLLLVLLIYGSSLYFVDFDVSRLWSGLPRLAHWAGKAWPPDIREFGVLIERAVETLAMAVIGTTIGVVIAAPCCVLAAQNITPSRLLYTPMRWFLNTLRGIDSFIFALLFVAAVGLGPFAGVLGIGLHSAGTIAKLWSEAIEAVEAGPLEAAALTGANRLKVIRYALLPDVLPNLTSITLYVWEFNVRSSTVLGVVGAGGIGQELKNSVDLLDFARLFTIILIILAMVTMIDQFSAWLRRRLV